LQENHWFGRKSGESVKIKIMKILAVGASGGAWFKIPSNKTR